MIMIDLITDSIMVCVQMTLSNHGMGSYDYDGISVWVRITMVRVQIINDLRRSTTAQSPLLLHERFH
jgi:hypothetical protein